MQDAKLLQRELPIQDRLRVRHKYNIFNDMPILIQGWNSLQYLYFLSNIFVSYYCVVQTFYDVSQNLRFGFYL